MFKKILVPIEVDYPDTAKAVYQKTAALAKQSGAKIQLVSVMPGFGMPIVASYISDEVRQEAEARFKESLEGADLIVVYHNRRREINEIFSNSCSQRVADNANCSVLRLRNIQI
jgi:nucleotide-binding universal stress UspA family protein